MNGLALALLLAASVPLQAQERSPAPNAVVAADGSSRYRTIQEAIDAVPQTTGENNRWIILVKKGTYREVVYVQHEKRFVTLAGEVQSQASIEFCASHVEHEKQRRADFRDVTRRTKNDVVLRVRAIELPRRLEEFKELFNYT